MCELNDEALACNPLAGVAGRTLGSLSSSASSSALLLQTGKPPVLRQQIIICIGVHVRPRQLGSAHATGQGDLLAKDFQFPTNLSKFLQAHCLPQPELGYHVQEHGWSEAESVSCDDEISSHAATRSEVEQNSATWHAKLLGLCGAGETDIG
jgi:hypothetical protein